MEAKNKKVKVVMLETTKNKKNIGEFIICKMTNSIEQKGLECGIMQQMPSQILKIKYYNIFIISDDEIKIGDWCLNIDSKYSHKELCSIDNTYELNNYAKKHNCKKIIATTDSTLNLPILPIPFIKEYCKKDGINEVEVVYYRDEESMQENIDSFGKVSSWKLKTNSNNEISISSVKNSWNREEVMQLIIDAFEAGYISKEAEANGGKIVDVDEWIRENL